MATTAGGPLYGNSDLFRANLKEALRLYDLNLMFPAYMLLAGVSGDSKQLYERFATVSGLSLPQPTAEFGVAPQSDIAEVAAANRQPIKQTLQMRISDESLINDQYGIVKSYGTELRSVFDIRREISASVYLNGCTDSTQINLINGEALSSATHALAVGTDANTWLSTENQQILSIKALEDATARISMQKSYKNYPAPRYGPFQLEVAQQNVHLANRLIGTDKLPQSLDNDINSVKQNPLDRMMVKRVVSTPTFLNPEWWSLRAIPSSQHSRYWLIRYGFNLTEIRYKGSNDSWCVTAKENYIPLQGDYRGTFYSTPA